MYRAYKTLKYSLDKVVLFALFAIALIIAYVIVWHRSALILSEPIILPRTGLSIKLPTGNGWHSFDKWIYKKSGYILNSNFVVGSANPSAQVYCRVELAAEDISYTQRFEEKAQQIEGQITDSGERDLDSLSIKWAHIKDDKMVFDVFYGVAKLPFNRLLTIEVHQFLSDTKMTKEAFEKILNSITFKENNFLEAGSGLVEELKNYGINNFWFGKQREDIFLIADPAKRPIGFFVDTYLNYQNDLDYDVQGSGILYLQRPYSKQVLVSFYCDFSFDNITLRSENIRPGSREGTEIVIDQDRNMSVRKSITPGKIDSYLLSQAAIPDTFTAFAYELFAQGDDKEIMLDFIDSDGLITPTYISKVDPDQYDSAPEGTAYILKSERLNDMQVSEIIFLDPDKQILKILLFEDQIYSIIRTDADTILKYFPNQKDLIDSITIPAEQM